MDNVIFPRKLLKSFIRLYRDQPCLWDRNCPLYKQKKKRQDALKKLTALVQQYDSTATKVHILRKIESLRACMRREHKRVMDSRLKANSPDEVYVPHLWYYDLLSFVFGEDENDQKIKELPSSEPEESFEDEGVDQDEQPFHQPLETFTVQYNSVSSNVIDVASEPPGSRRYCNFEEDQTKAKRHCTETDDEYDAIGINVAAKLRHLPQNMRILAEKLINDVLFQAQINALSPSTVISTLDPFK